MSDAIGELDPFSALECFQNIAIIGVIHLCGTKLRSRESARMSSLRRTCVLPNVPSADNLKVGLMALFCAPPDAAVRASEGGVPMKVNLSHEGSNSESASRSQED